MANSPVLTSVSENTPALIVGGDPELISDLAGTVTLFGSNLFGSAIITGPGLSGPLTIGGIGNGSYLQLFSFKAPAAGSYSVQVGTSNTLSFTVYPELTPALTDVGAVGIAADEARRTYSRFLG
jgi:hypothetical protein